MIAKNDLIRLTITALTSEGDGVARTEDGVVVFIPDTAPGDIVEALILKVKKNIAYAKVSRVIEPSPDRIDADCPAASRCGGCVYRHLSYEAELRAKRRKVLDAVTRIGKLDGLLVKDIIPSENIDGYRNKAMIPVGLDREGRVVMGFYSRHSHRIAPCINCRLSPPVFNRITEVVYAFLCGRPSLVYTPANRSGVRHLYLRYAAATGDVMVCVVAGKRNFADDTILYNSLIEKFPEVKSIVVNVNPDDTNVILGRKTVTVYGCDTISDTLCGLRFELSAPSFYQVNHDQAERLYAKAREYAALTGGEALLDLYCGTGTIGLSMARDCRELIGVEIVPEAVANAQRNAARNDIGNARFLCGDASAAAEKLREEGTAPDVIVVDPPRKGLTPELIDTIAGMQPDRVVYVSCDPATLARDLSLFAEKNYSVEEITPVDMFPRTAHVESVCRLTRFIKNVTQKLALAEKHIDEGKVFDASKSLQTLRGKYGL
jgi:23S rRNA (uracil1939-C5)-methyltransferase